MYISNDSKLDKAFEDKMNCNFKELVKVSVRKCLTVATPLSNQGHSYRKAL